MIPGLERPPGGGNDNELQYSCLENPAGQRSLVGYSPLCHRESDMTEWLGTYLLLFTRGFIYHFSFVLECQVIPSLSHFQLVAKLLKVIIKNQEKRNQKLPRAF